MTRTASILSLWVIAICTSTGFAQTVTPDAKNHPRIFISEEDIPRLREAVRSGTPQFMYAQIIARCDTLLDSTNLDSPRWSKVTSQGNNWDAARDLIDISVGWAIGGDDRYGNLAVDALMKLCTWPTWYIDYEPNRGVLLQAAAVAYDLLFDRLGPERAATVAAKLAFEAEEMAEFIYGEDGRGSVGYHSSMAPRTYGAFGVAAIALVDEYPKAREWAQFCAEQIPQWVDVGLDEQGAFYYSSEACYNTLALNYLLGFYIAWQRLTGNNLADTPKLRNNVIFQLYKLEPQRDGQGQFGVYGRRTTCPQNMVGLARLFDDGLARWYYEYVNGPQGLSLRGKVYSAEDNSFPLLWWKDVPIEYPDSSPRLGGALYCEGSGKLVLRTGFESVDDIHFALESRVPSHGHSQADHGNFILNAFGERFIEDSGTQPNYGWGMASAAHSIVMIDDEAQATSSHGSVDEFLHSDLFDYVRANPEPAYDAQSPVERALRHVIFIRPSCFIIIDDVIKDDQPHRYELLLHSDKHRQVDELSVGQYMMRGEKADMLIHFAAPEQVNISPPTRERMEQYVRDIPANRLSDASKQRWLAGMEAPENMPPFHIFGTPEPRDRGLFMTLLCPVQSGKSMPSVDSGSLDGAVTATLDGGATVWFNTDGKTIAVPGLETDATVCGLAGDAGGGWLAVDCTRFAADGIEMTSARPVSIALCAGAGQMHAAAETTVSFRAMGISGIELGGAMLEPLRRNADAITVRIPAGRHDVRLVTGD